MQWIIPHLTAGPRLERWEERPYSSGVERGPVPSDHRDRHERIIAWEEPGPPGAVAHRLATAILAFDVFPPALVTPIVRRRPVQVGDAVGVCYHVVAGLDLFFASRVIARFDETRGTLWRCGFIYRTLTGHPECGEEEFCVEKDTTTGRVLVALRSWSRPGLWLVRAGQPLLRPLQIAAGRAALDHLEALARAERPALARYRPRRDLRTSLLRGGGD